MPKTPKNEEKIIVDAIAAYHDRNNPKVKPLAREFGLSYQKLRGRIAGRTSPNERSATHKALTYTEEEALVRWINVLTDGNASPIAEIEQAANGILRERDPINLKPLGKT